MPPLIMPLLAVAASVLSTAAAYADLGDQLAKLLADDGAADDHFGFSVAISGATAIVGAWRHDDNGENSGSAYLFDTTSGGQIAKLLPDDGAVGDRFGGSVAISGTTAIIGAHSDEDNGVLSGSAYLFDTTTGRQIAKLLPNDGATQDRFGRSVAINGAIAIIGAYADDDNGELSGSAYLFDATTGLQIAKLLATDGARGDRFGYSVAINGAIAIIGAYADDDNGELSGSAYLFDISDPANPTQSAKLLPKDGQTGDWFGLSVAISGATAIAGAYQDNDNGQVSGSAYLFDTSIPTLPLQIAKLLPSDGVSGDRFGFSVAISGATAIIGAFSDAHLGLTSGSAYLFDATTGLQIAKILADDRAAGDEFGFSVAITGAAGNETAIVGTHRDDDNGSNSGSAYLFDAAAPGKCPWDLDDNGSVGVSDLLSLLASWGPCKGCPADFDGNGNVGVSDLLTLLANWGPCP